MANGNDGLEPGVTPLKWAEDHEKRACGSRREGYMYLVLILVLLVITIMLCKEAGTFLNDEIGRSAKKAQEIAEDSAKNAQEIAEDSAENAQETVIVEDQDSSRSISLRDIARCGDTAIAVGRRGVIQVSTDDGNTWEGSSIGTRRLDAIAFSGKCAVAIAVGRRGVILVSTDSGKTWDAPQTGTRNSFNDVALSDDGKTAIAVGDRGLFRFSRDGGQTWEPDNVTSQNVNGVALSGDGDTAVAVGDDNFIRVFTKQDGKWIPGKDWTDHEGNNAWTRSGGSKRDDFEAVALGSDGKSAVVVGDDGAILFSADVRAGDGGWSRETGKEDSDDFKAVAISENGKTVVAVGQRGTIWRSVNGGKSWSFRDSRQGNTLKAVAVSDDGEVAVAVGRDGTVLASEDHGKGWMFHDGSMANRLYGVAFDARGRTAIIVGDKSIILRLEFSSGKTPSMEILREEVVPVGSDAGEQRVSPPDMTKTYSGGLFQRQAEIEQRLVEREQADLNLFLILIYLTRAGIIVVFMFIAQHLFGLFRYKLRLAAYYDARRDAILLVPKDALPRPRNIDEFDQLMQALSPDDLEIGRPSKTVMDRMMRMMDRFIPGGRRRGGDCACKAGKCTCKPGADAPG